MVPRRRFALPLTSAALGALLLAACQQDPGPVVTSPADIAAQTAQGVAAARSLHFTGSLQATDPLQVDLVLQFRDGGDAAGSGSVAGMPFTLVVTGGRTFVQAAADYWRRAGPASDRAGRALGGKWVLDRADDRSSYGFQIVNLVQALRQLIKGHLIADVVALIGSLDVVLGEVDR